MLLVAHLERLAFVHSHTCKASAGKYVLGESTVEKGNRFKRRNSALNTSLGCPFSDPLLDVTNFWWVSRKPNLSTNNKN